MSDQTLDHFRSNQQIISTNLVFISFLSLLLNIANLKITHSFSHNCNHESSGCASHHKEQELAPREFNSTLDGEFTKNSPSKEKIISDSDSDLRHSCSHSHETSENNLCTKDIEPRHNHPSFHDTENIDKLVCVHKSSHYDFNSMVYESPSSKSNIQAMILHMIFDIVSSLVVLLSSILIRFFNVFLFDPICCLFISVVIFCSSIPLFMQSIRQIFPLPIDFKLLFDDTLIVDYNELNKKCVRLSQGNFSVLYLDVDKGLQKLMNEGHINKFCQIHGFTNLVFSIN